MTHWRSSRQASLGGFDQPADPPRGQLIPFPHNSLSQSLLTARPPLEGGDLRAAALDIGALCFFALFLCSAAAMFGLFVAAIVFIWG